MTKPRIVILASGSGTTAEAVIRGSAEGTLNAEVVAVVYNNQHAGVVERVKNCAAEFGLSIGLHYISSKNFPNSDNTIAESGRQTDSEESEILRVIDSYEPSLVALLGYMKLVGPTIVAKYGYLPQLGSPYQAKMINTHPGLLPETKGFYGIHVQEFVITNKTRAGHCIFSVDAEYDGGPVVAEHTVELYENDTADVLFERVKQSEKIYIVQDINNFLTKQKEEYEK